MSSVCLEHLLRYIRALPTIRVHPELDGPMLDVVHSLNSPVKICHNLNRVRCLQLSHNCDNEIDSLQITSVRKAELTIYESLWLGTEKSANCSYYLQGCALTAPGRLRRLTFGLGKLKKKSGCPSGRLDFSLCENLKQNQQTYWNGMKQKETSSRSCAPVSSCTIFAQACVEDLILKTVWQLCWFPGTVKSIQRYSFKMSRISKDSHSAMVPSAGCCTNLHSGFN